MNNVKLFAYTRTDNDNNDISDLIAFCARVSNPNNQHNTKTSKKLLQYLLDHKHFSPFEMANIVLEINTTRDIARQLLRHRSFTFQEFSQRYADPSIISDVMITREARLQDKTNRQNSIDIDDEVLKDEWDVVQLNVIDMASKAYNWALSHGIAKEQARSVLPEGMTHSRLYVNGTVRSWIHYIQTRTDPSTQKEHRLLAIECAKQIQTIFPSIMDFVQDKSISQ